MGEYAGSAGFIDEALGWLNKSYAASIRYEDAEGMRLGNIIRCQVLVKAGRAVETIPFLSSDDHISPYMCLTEHIIWAETLFELGDKHGAAERLARFYTVVDEHDMEHHRWKGDAIAERI